MSDRFGGLISAIKKWWDADEAQPASRDVAEEAHKALPDSLSARRAVEEDRRRKKKLIDDLER
jgi:hypothetical protein